MKYSPKQYAAAFLAAVKDKKKDQRIEVMRRLLSVVSRHGASPRLGLILAEVERQYFKEQRMKKIEVESPNVLAPAVRKEIEAIFGKNIFLKEKINSGVIAGIKVLIDDETLIDASAEAQLKKLFLSS